MSLINKGDSKRQKKRIGSYKLSRELGHGSYCQVFEAFHVLTGERVAVKLASVADSRAEPPARTFSAMYAATTARRDGSVDSIVRAAKCRSPSPLLLDADAASSSPRSLLRRKSAADEQDDELSSEQTDTDLSSSAELATTTATTKKKRKKKKKKRRRKKRQDSSEAEGDSAQQLMRARRLQRSMSHDSSGEAVVATSRRSQSHLQQLQTEGLFLMLVDHPNIVFLKDLVYEAGRIALVEELIEGPTLHAWLLSSSSASSSSSPAFGRVAALPSPRCSKADVCDMFRQMASAVCYVHELGLCHRDIKLENFLVASRGHALQVKLADFGFACLSPCWRSSDDHEVFVDSLLHSFVGSLHYVAPEVARKTPYHGAAADMWSLGVCLFALLHRRLPYSHAVGDDKLLAAVQSGRAADYIDSDLDPLARSLVEQLLQPSPALRIKAPQVLEHPWLCEPFNSSLHPSPITDHPPSSDQSSTKLLTDQSSTPSDQSASLIHQSSTPSITSDQVIHQSSSNSLTDQPTHQSSNNSLSDHPSSSRQSLDSALPAESPSSSSFAASSATSSRSLSFSNSAPSMLNSAPPHSDAQQPRGVLPQLMLTGSLQNIFDLQLSRLHGPAFLPSWCFDDDPVAPVDSDLVRYLTELGFSQQWIVAELASSRDNATKTYYRVLLARLQERSGYRSTNRSSPRHLLLSREKDQSRRIADSPRFAALLTERLLPILPIISRRLGPKAVLSPSASQDQLGDPPSSLLLPHHRRTLQQS